MRPSPTSPPAYGQFIHAIAPTGNEWFHGERVTYARRILREWLSAHITIPVRAGVSPSVLPKFHRDLTEKRDAPISLKWRRSPRSSGDEDYPASTSLSDRVFQ